MAMVSCRHYCNRRDVPLADPHLLFADKVTHVYRRSRSLFAHGVMVATALATFLLTELNVGFVALWYVFMLATSGYHSYFGNSLLNGDKRTLSGVNTSRLTLLALLAGFGWGAAAVFMPFVSVHLQLLLILTLTAVAAASLPRMAALPVVNAAFMGGLFVPILIGLVVVFGVEHWMMIFVLLVIWAGLTDEARKAHTDLSNIYLTQQSLEAEVGKDKLTGIANRGAFDTSLEREWLLAQRMRVPVSVIMIDVDFFKKYNDRYGHQAGDDCLSRVAKALAGTVRRSSDMLARYGGEEFVALLFHMSRDDALMLAEALRRAVEAMNIEHRDNRLGVVTISLGGATCIPDKESLPEDLLRKADAALYQAKTEGRNQVAWATEGCRHPD